MPIPNEVADLLQDTRYGISFPCSSGCQMRFVHQGRDRGGFFSYSGYGGIRKAVEAAIERNKALRVKFKRGRSGRVVVNYHTTPKSNTGVVGVSGNRYFDKRRQRYYFRYQVNWRDHAGKPKVKSFNLLAESSTDQFLHAFRSALQFRKEWEAFLTGFDASKYGLWRAKRLYLPGTPDLPDSFWGVENPTTGLRDTG